MPVHNTGSRQTLSRPVRVVHVLEATEGGTRRWLENVVTGLDGARVSNAVICSTRRTPAFAESTERFRRDGVPVWIVDMRRAISPLHDASAVFRIASIFRRQRFDIVHAHSAKAGMLARIAARIAHRGPVVYSPHAFSFLMKGAMSSVYRALERAARPLTDAVLAVSEAERDMAYGLGYRPGKVFTIPNGVEASPESADSPERTHVGSITWFRRQKDPETFIRACALLYRRNRRLRFAVYGNGPGIAAAQLLADQEGLVDAIHFGGYVPEARTRLAEWDVFVCATHYEGLSYALLEAMAAGKAIVASRVPGVEEAVIDRTTGLLVPPGDPRAMADAITLLLEDPSLARRLGAAARARASEKYSLSQQLSALTAFYEDLSKGSLACLRK